MSCAELDVSVEAARAAGALGARMTGGGFGGSSIALLPVDAVDEAEQAVARGLRRAGLGRAALLRSSRPARRPPRRLTPLPPEPDLHVRTTKWCEGEGSGSGGKAGQRS